MTCYVSVNKILFQLTPDNSNPRQPANLPLTRSVFVFLSGHNVSRVNCMSNNSILVSLRCEFLLRGFDRDLRLSDNNAELTFVFGDDYVCKRNQREIVDYVIQGRHKNCSVIYLSQSFYKTPRDIRLNCSHYCIYEFPSSRERNMISSELGVDKEQFKKATKKPFSFLYVDKPRKKVKRNFTGEL